MVEMDSSAIVLENCPDQIYTWVFIWFWGRESSVLGVWVAPAAPKTMSEGGGRSPPHFEIVFGAAGAVKTPKFEDLRPAPKTCIENPSLARTLKVDTLFWWFAMDREITLKITLN